ncbi:hypothetical protein CCACVL1_24433 [Corchorus capsularis]|uniref:TF-B3 domain-containing protein n=1 Tax=Corchorus capsularis TaxID=210143 RepID=A0A1R3GPR2_COCAP|nr:hypothetical protein CCACVL1_24433 [Corchorus capsularis]
MTVGTRSGSMRMAGSRRGWRPAPWPGRDLHATRAMAIPKQFIKKYGKCMSSPAAFLRVPSGEVWKVELRKRDGKVWLKKGWREFSNHYSLKHGHFVVFSYEGKCNFDVVIMDRTASEIEYPYTRNHVSCNSKRFSDESESEDDESIQILEDIPPSRKNREKSDLPCFRPHKKMKTSDSADYITESILKSECMNPSRNKNAFALGRAIRDFKSENPFFVVVMQPSYVYAGLQCKCRLAIPIYFVRKHLMKDDCEITLFNSDGKTWPVQFHQGGNGKKLYGSLNAGWDIFVHDNNIQVGDICVFELINCIEIAFKVVIYQGEDGTFHKSSDLNDVFGQPKGNAGASYHPSQCVEDDKSRPLARKAGASSRSRGCWVQLNALQKAKALQLARAFRSENPSFTVVMQPSYVHTSLVCIPENFAMRYFKKMQPKMNHEVLLCLSDGKSWPVKYYQLTDTGRSAKFCCGWKQFALDNDLEVGNVCVFEMVAETSFKVTIYRKQAIEGANLGSSSAKSGANVIRIECDESLEINAESNLLQHKGMPICNLQNQHLSEETCSANNGEKTQEENTDSPGKDLEEAGQIFQTPSNGNVQDTDRQD